MAHSAATTAVAVTEKTSKKMRAVCAGEEGFGGSSVKAFQFAFSNSYYNGTGDDLGGALVGDDKLFEGGVILVALNTLDTTGNYHIRLDPDTLKVFAYDEDNTSGIMAEVADNTDLHTIVVEGYAIGY